MRTEWDRDTFLDGEEHCYPNGGEMRMGRAVYPDGKVRRVWGGMPDTYFSIPAHGRYQRKYVTGYMTIEQDEGERWLQFRITHPVLDNCGADVDVPRKEEK